jgi:hypothetical protein
VLEGHDSLPSREALYRDELGFFQGGEGAGGRVAVHAEAREFRTPERYLASSRDPGEEPQHDSEV